MPERQANTRARLWYHDVDFKLVHELISIKIQHSLYASKVSYYVFFCMLDTENNNCIWDMQQWPPHDKG